MGDNQTQHGDGSFAGYGTSFNIIRNGDGKVLQVDIQGSSSVKQIKVEDDGSYTLIPVHPDLSPVNFMPTPDDLKAGALNAGVTIAIDTKRAILQKYAGDAHASSLFDKIVGDIKVGDRLVLGSVAGLAVATALLPVAILSDMRGDKNTLGEAIFREVPSTLAGAAVGATLGGLAAGIAEGAGAGAFAGPVGIILGGVAGAAVSFGISKEIQNEINAGKAPHADQLLFLPDDPDYLKAYIHDRSSAHPDWNLVGYPPSGVDLNQFNAWKQSILIANQKLTKELHPEMAVTQAYYLHVDPETDARYGVTMDNIDGPWIRPRQPAVKRLPVPASDSPSTGDLEHIPYSRPGIPNMGFGGAGSAIFNSPPIQRFLPALADLIWQFASPHATGGDIKGPGSTIGDKIPAFLSDGEFVVNAASANANRPLLKAINDDPLYMKKYLQQMEGMVAAALTKVRATPNDRGERVDQSMNVHISAYDVHEAFAKAKLWQQRHAMMD
ncbi:hypothetical protein OG203_06245 [Nocardia sp. NBC_01499]|uniref:hypothetical protein n=1 Tax=Nocardia sp. NBC_01499 TaxID=2903597 RepID=UPI00386DDD15